MRKSWNWRSHLTPDEEKIVQDYDGMRDEISYIEGKNAELILKISKIRNRCIQRARYKEIGK